MKTLTLIRHAKSSWDHPDLDDLHRPLNRRGEESAPLMARWLRQQGFQTDLLLSSPAERALATARILANGINYPADLDIASWLYDASAIDLLEGIAHTSDVVAHLTLVGHNPGLTELINQLGDQPIDNLPTCGVCTLQLPMAHWSDIHATTGHRLPSRCCRQPQSQTHWRRDAGTTLVSRRRVSAIAADPADGDGGSWPAWLLWLFHLLHLSGAVRPRL